MMFPLTVVLQWMKWYSNKERKKERKNGIDAFAVASLSMSIVLRILSAPLFYRLSSVCAVRLCCTSLSHGHGGIPKRLRYSRRWCQWYVRHSFSPCLSLSPPSLSSFSLSLSLSLFLSLLSLSLHLFIHRSISLYLNLCILRVHQMRVSLGGIVRDRPRSFHSAAFVL